jgi:hypothetical protein
MRRELYESLEPVTGEVFLERLQKMQSDASRAQAEAEGLEAQAKAAKKTMEAEFGAVHQMLGSRNANVPIYLLKTGAMTTQPPDKQQELPLAKGKGAEPAGADGNGKGRRAK